MVGGLAVVFGSFFATLYVLDHVTSTLDYGVDLTGATYKTIVMEKNTSALACLSYCTKDIPCTGWVYAPAMPPDWPMPRCFLKEKALSPTNNSALVSGVVRRSLSAFF